MKESRVKIFGIKREMTLKQARIIGIVTGRERFYNAEFLVIGVCFKFPFLRGIRLRLRG
jgi:hypothetical protein